MRHLHVICKATPSIFTEAVESLLSEFETAGWRVTFDPAFKTDDAREYSHDVNIVVKAQRVYNPYHLPNDAVNILLQTEQFSKLRQFNSMPYVEDWDLILDVFSDNVKRINDFVGVKFAPTRYFPIGYHPKYQQGTNKGVAVRDKNCELDVYFFGAHTTYRRKIWKEIVEKVSIYSRFGNTDLDEEKYRYITHAKINVFIDGWTPYLLPMMHCMQVLANNRYLLVISEDENQNYSPYSASKHFDVVHPDKAGQFIADILRSEERRLFVSSRSHEDIIAHHEFSMYLRKALKGFVDIGR